jgi:site-specific DNA recombinase
MPALASLPVSKAVLTRTTYVGRRERKAETEIVEMAVPSIIDVAEFEVVQRCPSPAARL